MVRANRKDKLGSGSRSPSTSAFKREESKMPGPDYSPEVMRAAVLGVTERKMPIRRSAREHGVPESSLREHLKSPRMGFKCGHVPILTEKDERAIVDYAECMAKSQFPLTRTDIKAKIQSMVAGRKRKFGRNGPSTQWLNIFFKRHPQLLSLSKVRPLPSVELGDTVLAKHNDGNFHSSKVVDIHQQIYYKVDFIDGSSSNDLFAEDIVVRKTRKTSNDLFAEDIVSHDCEENGPPPLMTVVKVRWVDNEIYHGHFKGTAQHTGFTVEFKDGTELRTTREDLFARGEQLPKRVRSSMDESDDVKIAISSYSNHQPANLFLPPTSLNFNTDVDTGEDECEVVIEDDRMDNIVLLDQEEQAFEPHKVLSFGGSSSNAAAAPVVSDVCTKCQKANRTIQDLQDTVSRQNQLLDEYKSKYGSLDSEDAFIPSVHSESAVRNAVLGIVRLSQNNSASPSYDESPENGLKYDLSEETRLQQTPAGTPKNNTAHNNSLSRMSQNAACAAAIGDHTY